MDNPYCPICKAPIDEKIRIHKKDETPVFNPTENCNNEWFIHIDNKLYLISHPKLYKVKDETKEGSIKVEV